MNVGIRAAKSNFFDRPKVEAALSRAEHARLSRFGAFVQRRAQSSMMRRNIRGKFGIHSKVKNWTVSADPGRPPMPHTGLIVKWTQFVYEPNRRSVIVGAVRLSRIGDAPHALEHGGPSVMMERRWGVKRRKRIKIAPRPFMRPAFEKEIQEGSHTFKDSIR